MNRNMKLALYLLVFLPLGAGLIWFNAGSPVKGESTPSSQSGKQGQGPLSQLNEKAKAAKGGNYAAVRELVDEIFSTVPVEEPFTAALGEVKERLVRAEINYLKGEQEGIPEPNIICSLNPIAEKFKAPEYARTTQYEVRKLRMATLSLLPDLIANGRSDETNRPEQIGPSINPRMSPAEATFITLLLLQQKLTNSAYQVTHAERLSQWAEKYAKPKDGAKQTSKIDPSARADEMQRVLNTGLAEMSPADLLSMAKSALDTLGVQK